MSDQRGFSNDGMWWWTGADWMPARPPDGLSARWTGSGWVSRGGSLDWATVLGIAVGLGFLELIWVLVGLLIVSSDVNARWEAGGRVGTESIFDSPLTVPILVTFSIVPIVVTVVTAANIRRYWWLAVPILGGWQVMGIAILMLVTPGTGKSESTAVIGGLLLAVVAIGWVVHTFVFRSWSLSPDGGTWVRGGRSVPTLSSDGRWRWDGHTWLPVNRGSSAG